MRCKGCGSQVPEGIRFCTYCGSEASEGEQQKRYQLKIIREKQWFAVNPPVKILVNHVDSYQIENGSELILELPEGEHEIEFSASIRNKVIVVSMNCDTTIGIRWNRATGAIEIDENHSVKTGSGANSISSAQGSGRPVVAKVQTNSKATIGFILSIVSLFLNFAGIMGIIALVFSVIGLQQIKTRHENGRVFAIVGIVIGAFSILYACMVLML